MHSPLPTLDEPLSAHLRENTHEPRDGHEIDTAGDWQYGFIDKYRTIEVGQNFKIFVKNSTIWIATNDTISLVNGERESCLDEARDPRTQFGTCTNQMAEKSEVRLSWIKLQARYQWIFYKDKYGLMIYR